eukprot:scaffold4730_cov109-Isochrysis_galbana.AAC.9
MGLVDQFHISANGLVTLSDAMPKSSPPAALFGSGIRVHQHRCFITGESRHDNFVERGPAHFVQSSTPMAFISGGISFSVPFPNLRSEVSSVAIPFQCVYASITSERDGRKDMTHFLTAARCHA